MTFQSGLKIEQLIVRVSRKDKLIMTKYQFKEEMHKLIKTTVPRDVHMK
ncbi:MAG: hypothetical protein KJ799_04585 [Bacteroidetes bacterium]|nr:hypothetical protein [Bacteroidota bacterium]